MKFNLDAKNNSDRFEQKCKPKALSFGNLKLLKKDTVTFKANKSVSNEQNDPYATINSIADKFYQKLKESLDQGLSFLQENIKNLTVRYVPGGSSAGQARIVPPEIFGGPVRYEIDINEDTANLNEPALHEGYHILQFEYDNTEPFVNTQKMLTRSLSINPKVRNDYDQITKIIVNEIFLPVFDKNLNKTRENILKNMSKFNDKRVEEINNGKIFDKNQNLLAPELSEWFKKLTKESYLKYIASHACIEIKAHSYCMSKDEQPVIIGRGNINMNKLRDLIAIKIYSEIIDMAETALKESENKKAKLHIA